jgi:hypothetical protein
MKMFKTLFIAFYVLVLMGFTACDSGSDAKQKVKICPQCHMELPKLSTNTSLIIQDGETTYFDDIGCMVLWAKENNIDLKKLTVKAFTHDTKKYMDAFHLYYTINESTPMHYGFGAYEKQVDNSIDFNEVILKMLRGENMANPKIRKQILGQ